MAAQPSSCAAASRHVEPPASLKGRTPRHASDRAGQPKPAKATAPAAQAVQIVPSRPPGPAIARMPTPMTTAAKPRPLPSMPVSASTADCCAARATSAEEAQASPIIARRGPRPGKRAPSKPESENAPLFRRIGPKKYPVSATPAKRPPQTPMSHGRVTR